MFRHSRIVAGETQCTSVTERTIHAVKPFIRNSAKQALIIKRVDLFCESTSNFPALL
jgi:hypothetical protein